MRYSISAVWCAIECSLFPGLETALEEPLSASLRQVAATLEVVRIEDYVAPSSWQMRGRPQVERGHIARALVAKAVMDIPTTKGLRQALLGDRGLRRICGFERQRDVPSEPTLSRAFGEFARSGLAQRVHEAMTDTYVGERVVMHLCRDATEVVARETPHRKMPVESRPRRKCGRKGRNDAPREMTRLEKQRSQTPEQALAELPDVCDIGVKADTHGKRHYWVGYKAHIDWADGGYALQTRLTSASVHDSQVAIPMAKLSARKHTVLYEVMDAGYDANEIIAAVEDLGHRPIIAHHSRRTKCVPLDPATQERYKVRTVAERGNARLKDEFGLRHVRVRGACKVYAHMMYGVLALCADVLLKMAAGST